MLQLTAHVDLMRLCSPLVSVVLYRLSLALPDSHINGPASQDTYSQDYAN